MSRLAQRLGKLEQIQSVGESDLENLTDEELLSSIRKSAELDGIDWEAFKNDPEGETRKSFEKSRRILGRFEGAPNDDQLEAQVLDALRRLKFDWLNEIESGLNDPSPKCHQSSIGEGV